VHGFRNHHAHGSLRRHDADTNFTQLTPLNSTNLNVLAAKESSDPGKSVGSRLMDKIVRMQIETCVHMKGLYETKFRAYEDCLEMLLKLCNPGKDMVMDGDPGETPTGMGFCQTYFGVERIMRDEVKEHTEECVALAEKHPRNREDGGKLKACESFMDELCAKNADKLMDKKSKRQLTGQGYCQRYFGDKDGTGTAAESRCCNRDCEHECKRWSTRCCEKCCKRQAVSSDGNGGDSAAAGAAGSGGAGGAGGSDGADGSGGTDGDSEEGSGHGGSGGAGGSEGSPKDRAGGASGSKDSPGEEPSAGTGKLIFVALLGLCLIASCCVGLVLFFKKSASEQEEPSES